MGGQRWWWWLVAVAAASLDAAGAVPWQAQAGHPHGVAGLAFSPDGRRLASGGVDDGSVIVWDLASGRSLLRCTGLRDAVRSVAWLDGGAALAAGSADDGAFVPCHGVLRVWDATTGAERFTREVGPGLRLRAVPGSGRWLLGDRLLWDPATNQFSGRADDRFRQAVPVAGSRYVVLDREGGLWLHDLDSGRELARLAPEQNWGGPLCASADGRRVAAWISPRPAEHDVAVYDLVEQRLVQRFADCGPSYHTLALSPDGSVVAVPLAGQGARFVLLDVASGQVRARQTVVGEQVVVLAFSPDGARLAVDDGDCGVTLVDTRTGRVTQRLGNALPGELRPRLSADGTRLDVTAYPRWRYGRERAPLFRRVWSLADGRPLGATLAGESPDALSPDGQTAALLSGRDVRLRDQRTGTVRTLSAHVRPVRCVSFSPDGRRLASGGEDGLVYVWPVEGNAPPERLVHEFYPTNVVADPPDGMYVYSVDFNAAGTQVAAGVLGGVRVFTLGRPATQFDLPEMLVKLAEAPQALRWFADGRLLVGTRRGGALYDGGAAVVTYLLARGPLAVSADGRWLAAADLDGGVRCYETRSGRLLACVYAPDEQAWAVLSPDGDWEADQSATLRHFHRLLPGGEPVLLTVRRAGRQVSGLLPRLLR